MTWRLKIENCIQEAGTTSASLLPRSYPASFPRPAASAFRRSHEILILLYLVKITRADLYWLGPKDPKWSTFPYRTSKNSPKTGRGRKITAPMCVALLTPPMCVALY